MNELRNIFHLILFLGAGVENVLENVYLVDDAIVTTNSSSQPLLGVEQSAFWENNSQLK